MSSLLVSGLVHTVSLKVSFMEALVEKPAGQTGGCLSRTSVRI